MVKLRLTALLFLPHKDRRSSEGLGCIWTAFDSSSVFCSGQSRVTWIQASLGCEWCLLWKKLMGFCCGCVSHVLLTCLILDACTHVCTHVRRLHVNTQPGTDSFMCPLGWRELYKMWWHDISLSSVKNRRRPKSAKAERAIQFPDFTLNRRQEKGCRMWWRVITQGSFTSDDFSLQGRNERKRGECVKHFGPQLWSPFLTVVFGHETSPCYPPTCEKPSRSSSNFTNRKGVTLVICRFKGPFIDI